MKALQIFLGLVFGIVIGVFGGYKVATLKAHTAIIAGPWSDNYQPALNAINEAKVKIQSGNTNILEYLNTAQDQIVQAQKWTERFLSR